jgi:hypothetical protein
MTIEGTRLAHAHAKEIQAKDAEIARLTRERDEALDALAFNVIRRDGSMSVLGAP